VHGNLAALQAVLEDARAEGVERYVLGGDYTLFGPRPEETLETLRRLDGAEWIRGNGERWTDSPADAPDDEVVQGAISASRRVLGAEGARRLAELPESLVLDGVRYVHASPVSDVRSFLPEPGDDEDELLAGVEERRLVFGHTHVPFMREAFGGTELVNPGSVGMPFDGDPRASYAIVSQGGAIEHRRVEYDHETAAADVRTRFGPWAETVARRIERARFDA
jgi:diadenosine tetraphosphatase ApaH/serine/threonine PP2A family protein phosphatase